MKFNWGTGIVIFFIFFAVSMTFAVVSTTKYPPQLVQKDYYALDLNYQDRLERKQNASALPVLPKVQFNAASSAIQVEFPTGMVAQTGTAKCYRSSTTRDDVSLPLDNVSNLDIPTAQFKSGRWHVELNWETADGKKYFWENVIVL